MEQNNNIVPGTGKVDLIHRNGNTDDIISVIMLADNQNAANVVDFANSLPGNTVVEKCQALWQFLKDSIPYNEDPNGKQFVKLPGALYNDRSTELGGTGKGGDCKSYSIFISGCLKNLGIKHFYRFMSEDADADFHHVYICVPLDGKNYCVVDAVLDDFDTELPYAKKEDRWANMNAPVYAPEPKGVSGIGKRIGATQEELVSANWLQYEANFRDNFQSLKDSTITNLVNSVGNQYSGHPIQKDKARQAFQDNIADMLRYASCMIYMFWDTNKAEFPGTTYCHNLYPGGTPYGVTCDLTEKYNTGARLYQDFIDMGCQPQDLRNLTNIATYNVYGISMDYMLYRCYNMVNYGQPWEPVAGVPYYDYRRKEFVNTDPTPAGLIKTYKIGLCCPVAGGISAPYGIPYWANGGFVMQNGAPDDMFNAFVRDNPAKPEWIAKFPNNGAGLSDAEIQDAISVYNTWISGNMPALPTPLQAPGTQTSNTPNTTNPSQDVWTQNDDHPGGHHITPGFGGRPKVGVVFTGAEIVGIVAAIVTAIATIASIVASILSKTKFNPAQHQIPTPPTDFHMEYTTLDGCFIGTAPAECPAGKMKYCPSTGTGTCLDASQLNLPENQPATPTDGFGGALSGLSTNQKYLLLGAAGLLLLVLLSGDGK